MNGYYYFSSIVFSDEGDILHGEQDPDAAYDRLIRPWKSRLGLLYIDNQSVLLDLKLIAATVVAIFSKPLALKWLIPEVARLSSDPALITTCHRIEPLVPTALPGMELT